MYCKNCGNEIEGNFCKNCGTQNNSNLKQPDKKVSPCLCVLIAFLFVFLIQIILGFILSIIMLATTSH